MKRSRRRTSRSLVTILALAIVISAFSLVRRSFHGSIATKDDAMPTLSAIDVGAVTSTAQTRPSGETSVAADDATPLVQTTTPDTLTTSAQPATGANVATANIAAPPSAGAPIASAAAPDTRPSGDVANGATWTQLLNSGSNNGTSTIAPPAAGPIVTGNGPLADGRARIAAGDLLSARAVLNDALLAGKLSDADGAATKSLISQINQTVVFSARLFPADPYGGTYAVRQGDSLAKIAAAHNTTWELLARINNLEPRRLRYGSKIKVVRGPFFAVVNKKAFTMDVYLGNLPTEKGAMYVTSFPVGLGKDDSTPTGLWSIGVHAKLRHPTYYPPEGGQPIEADDPANPLGGYWVGLTGVDGQAVGAASYGIHGTIDPASIGHQASMGCVRLKNEDIPLVFDLMVEGKSMVLIKA